MALYAHEEVIEIMGNPSGQRPYGLYPLPAGELRREPFLMGLIKEDPEDC